MKTLIEKHKTIKILLVEDDPDDQFIFSEAINRISTPVDLRMIEDGNKIFDFEDIPHVIFLDLNMPKINGIECLKKIKENAQFKDIPCIIFSTSIAKKDIELSFNHGANLYLRKPYNFDLLLKLLNWVFEVNWKEYFPPTKEKFFIEEKQLKQY